MSYTWSATGDLVCYTKNSGWQNMPEWCPAESAGSSRKRSIIPPQTKVQQPSLWESLGFGGGGTKERFTTSHTYNFSIMIMDKQGNVMYSKDFHNMTPSNGDFIDSFKPGMEFALKPVIVVATDVTTYPREDPNKPRLALKIQYNRDKQNANIVFNKTMDLGMVQKRTAEFEITYFEPEGMNIMFNTNSMV